jgi:hypothetical protein
MSAIQKIIEFLKIFPNKNKFHVQSKSNNLNTIEDAIEDIRQAQ